MDRTTNLALLATMLAFLTLPSCAATADDAGDDMEVASEELTAASLRGYFQFDRATSTSRWLEAVALHHDGTFEANVGNNISNLSGHHHPAAGTYTLTPTPKGALLTLDYDFVGPTTDRYDVEVTGNSVRMKLREADLAGWFTMNPRKATTLTFAEDWTVSQDGPLVADAPLVVRYAAGRNPCAPPQGGGLSTVMNASVDGNRRWWIVQAFGQKPVDGVLGSVGFVPDGHHLTVWFENSAVTEHGTRTSCRSWDSRFGQNYVFRITKS